MDGAAEKNREGNDIPSLAGLAANDWIGELLGQLMDSGIPMPDMDGLIAATVLSENLTLVTQNVADFDALSDLQIEN